MTSQGILDILRAKGICNYKGTFHVSYIGIDFLTINKYVYMRSKPYLRPLCLKVNLYTQCDVWNTHACFYAITL